MLRKRRKINIKMVVLLSPFFISKKNMYICNKFEKYKTLQ